MQRERDVYRHPSILLHFLFQSKQRTELLCPPPTLKAPDIPLPLFFSPPPLCSQLNIESYFFGYFQSALKLTGTGSGRVSAFMVESMCCIFKERQTCPFLSQCNSTVKDGNVLTTRNGGVGGGCSHLCAHLCLFIHGRLITLCWKCTAQVSGGPLQCLTPWSPASGSAQSGGTDSDCS